MRDQSLTAQATADDLAPECLYRFLSAVVAGPYSADWARASDAENRDLVLGAWQWLQPESDEFEMIRLIDELEASPQVLCAAVRLGLRTGGPQGMPPVRDRVLSNPRDLWSLAADGRCRRFLQGVWNRAGTVLA